MDEEGVKEPLLSPEERQPAAGSPAGAPSVATLSRNSEAPSQHSDRQAHAEQPAPAANYDEEAATGVPVEGTTFDETLLPSVPEATTRWRAQKALMLAWLLGSIVTLLLSSLSPFLGTTAALAGITGSSWYFCHCCGVKQAKDIAANIQVVRRLALLSGWLSGLYTFLLAIVSLGACKGDDQYAEYCGVLQIMFFILTMWHLLHAAVSLRVAYKAYKIEPLLNPFSSGVLS